MSSRVMLAIGLAVVICATIAGLLAAAHRPPFGRPAAASTIPPEYWMHGRRAVLE